MSSRSRALRPALCALLAPRRRKQRGPVDLARGDLRGLARGCTGAPGGAGSHRYRGAPWCFCGARGGGAAGRRSGGALVVVAGTATKNAKVCWVCWGTQPAPARQHGNTATLLQTIIFLFSSSNGFSNACKCAFCSVDLRLLACRAFRAADSRDGRVSGEPPQESQCNVSLLFCPVRGRCRTSGSSWGLSRRAHPVGRAAPCPSPSPLPLSRSLPPARPALPHQ